MLILDGRAIIDIRSGEDYPLEFDRNYSISTRRLHFQGSSAREGECHGTSVAAPEFWDGVLLGDCPCCGVFAKFK